MPGSDGEVVSTSDTRFMNLLRHSSQAVFSRVKRLISFSYLGCDGLDVTEWLFPCFTETISRQFSDLLRCDDTRAAAISDDWKLPGPVGSVGHYSLCFSEMNIFSLERLSKTAALFSPFCSKCSQVHVKCRRAFKLRFRPNSHKTSPVIKGSDNRFHWDNWPLAFINLSTEACVSV